MPANFISEEELQSIDQQFSSQMSSVSKHADQPKPEAYNMEETAKAISAITKEQKQISELIHENEIGYTEGIVEFERGTKKVLRNLNLTVDTLTRSAKKILETTAKTSVDTILKVSQSIQEDVRLNKTNAVAMSLAASTPIFGYFAAKFMETGVFRDFSDKIKENLGEAISYLGNKIRGFFGQFKGKSFAELLTIAGEGFKSLLKFPFKIVGASLRGLWEMGKFIQTLPMKAIGLAFKGIVGMSKFILTLPFKALSLGFEALLMPFKMIGGALGAIKSGFKLDFGKGGNDPNRVPPKLAGGGYVKKGGTVQVHPAEVIAPVGKLSETLVDALDKSKMTIEVRKLRLSMVGLGSEFTASLFEGLTKNPITKGLIGAATVFKGVLKFLFRPKGKYFNQLPRSTSPLQNSATILGMIYATVNPKLDQLIRLLGGNPLDVTDKAGDKPKENQGILEKIIEVLGLSGQVELPQFQAGGFFKKKKKIQVDENEVVSPIEKLNGLFRFDFSDMFGEKKKGEAQKAGTGMLDFFKNWKKREKKAEDQKDNLSSIEKKNTKNLQKIAKNTGYLPEHMEKKKGLIGTVLLFAWSFIKNMMGMGLKGIGFALTNIGSLAGILYKSKIFTQLGVIVKMFTRMIGFTMRLGVGGLAGIAGTLMTLVDAVRGRAHAKEWFGKKGKKGKEGELTTSEKVFSTVGGAIGGVGDDPKKRAKWGATKGALLGASIGSFVPVIGTGIGAIVGAIVGGVAGAIGGKNIALAFSLAWKVVKNSLGAVWVGIKSMWYAFIVNPINDAFNAASKWIKTQLSDAGKWAYNNIPGVKQTVDFYQKTIKPWWQKWISPIVEWIKIHIIPAFQAAIFTFKWVINLFLHPLKTIKMILGGWKQIFGLVGETLGGADATKFLEEQNKKADADAKKIAEENKKAKNAKASDYAKAHGAAMDAGGGLIGDAPPGVSKPSFWDRTKAWVKGRGSKTARTEPTAPAGPGAPPQDSVTSPNSFAPGGSSSGINSLGRQSISAKKMSAKKYASGGDDSQIGLVKAIMDKFDEVGDRITNAIFMSTKAAVKALAPEQPQGLLSKLSNFVGGGIDKAVELGKDVGKAAVGTMKEVPNVIGEYGTKIKEGAKALGKKFSSAGWLSTSLPHVVKQQAQNDIEGLRPDVKKRLGEMALEYYKQTGNDVQVKSAYRNAAYQKKLYEEDQAKVRAGAPRSVSKPGATSPHMRGWAMDINTPVAQDLERRGISPSFGFVRPVQVWPNFKNEQFHMQTADTVGNWGGMPGGIKSPVAQQALAYFNKNKTEGDTPPGMTRNPISESTTRSRLNKNSILDSSLRNKTNEAAMVANNLVAGLAKQNELIAKSLLSIASTRNSSVTSSNVENNNSTSISNSGGGGSGQNDLMASLLSGNFPA